MRTLDQKGHERNELAIDMNCTGCEAVRSCGCAHQELLTCNEEGEVEVEMQHYLAMLVDSCWVVPQKAGRNASLK